MEDIRIGVEEISGNERFEQVIELEEYVQVARRGVYVNKINSIAIKAFTNEGRRIVSVYLLSDGQEISNFVVELKDIILERYSTIIWVI